MQARQPDAPAVPSGKRTCAFCKYWDVVNEECGDPVKAKHVGSATCKFANECAKKNKTRAASNEMQKKDFVKFSILNHKLDRKAFRWKETSRW